MVTSITIDQFRRWCQEEAQPGVVFDVSPEDFMMRWYLAHADYRGDPKGAIRVYFQGGKDDAETFASILTKILNFNARSSLRILEFAAGYGRMTRHLKSVLPNASIAACDIHPAAVSLTESMGIPSYVSASVPEALALPEKFDVVFALSFFSHIPPQTFGRWLASLHSKLRPGGFLIFTTMGRHKHAMEKRDRRELEGKLAYFIAASEQRDLPGDEYGSMFVTTDYVIDQIWQSTAAPIVFYREAFWNGGQDLYIVTTR